VGYYGTGDYYASGDWYGQGDPGVGSSLVKYGAGALAKRFMPGVGTALAGYGALKGLEKVAERTKVGKKILKARKGLKGMLGLGRARRHRRMNVCNPRALRRSLRRVKGFEHFARQVVRITSPRKRVSGFRFRRRRKTR